MILSLGTRSMKKLTAHSEANGTDKDTFLKCREQIIAVFMSVSLGTDTLQYRNYIHLSNTDIPYLVNVLFLPHLF